MNSIEQGPFRKPLPRNFPYFMEPESSFLCSQESATCAYPEPGLSTPSYPIYPRLLLEFLIILTLFWP
jgi:hypothetical protein